MKTYRIRVDEVQTVIYEIEAQSAQDAFDRYLMDGEFIDKEDDFSTEETTAEICEIDGQPLADNISVFNHQAIENN